MIFRAFSLAQRVTSSLALRVTSVSEYHYALPLLQTR